MAKLCDNLSVGVIVRNQTGNYALLERRKFPVGIAPIAGHVDDHGSLEQTALDEAHEELGVSLSLSDLIKTQIDDQRIDNACVRENGTFHKWTVYEATVSNQLLHPDQEETKGGDWYTPEIMQALADRTRAYERGEVPETDWEQSPGLEPVWVEHLTKLGHII